MPVSVAALVTRAVGLHPATVLHGRLERLRGLREREFEPGVVLDFDLRDDTGVVRVALRDDWARALTFATEGDMVRLERPVLQQAPHLSLIVTAAPETAVVVEQAADHGDVMLLRVTPSNFDDPEVSVKRLPSSRSLPTVVV